VTNREGVIKFHLDFRPGPVPARDAIAELGRWRQRLHALGLVGQDPARYEGLGFGNVSVRCAGGFWVSGTQTGGLAELGPQHYARVTAWDVAANAVTAVGPVRPSSEALTHAALYACDAALGCVLHVHSPRLWRAAPALGLPVTDPQVPYGTPQMSAEVARLYRDPAARARQLFSMGGHEDGLVAFGATPQEAGEVLLAALRNAGAMEEG